MPIYGTNNPPFALGFSYPTNRYLLLNAEAVTAGEFSERVAVPLGPTTGAKGIRIEGDFNANPGTFEFDIMESSTDERTAKNYQQVPTSGAITTTTTGNNGANTHFGVDLVPFAGEFCLLSIPTAPSNSNITVTVRIHRIA